MRLARIWLEPVLFGLLVYLSIENFGPSDVGYNRQVAGYMVAVAAALLVTGRMSGRSLVIDRSSVAIVAALAASVAISTLGASNTYVSVNRLHLYYATVMLGLALYMSQPRDARPAIGPYFAVIAIIHAYFLVQIFFWLMSVQSESILPMNRMPHYANIRHFAYHGFIAAASATALFTMSRRLEMTSLVLASVALFGIVLLGARGALIGWLACVIVLLCFHRERARLLAFSLIAATVSVGLVYYVTSSGIVRAPTLIQRVGSGMDSALYAADRLAIWVDAIRAIIGRPWFGYGPEGYILSRCCNPNVAQPHNFLLQFLLEVGVIGTGLMVLALTSIIRLPGGVRGFINSFASDSGTQGLLAVLLSFLAYATIDGLLYHAIPLMHFAVLASLLVASMKAAPAVRLEVTP